MVPNPVVERSLSIGDYVISAAPDLIKIDAVGTLGTDVSVIDPLRD
ncbi:MAG TPA: hypothetical protein VES58_04640 [Syntrophobacteria bacterium]|nr:hypothetical protein [Syntrophobacteria bacterium]